MHIKSSKLEIVRKSYRIRKFKDTINPSDALTKNKNMWKFTYFKPTQVYIFEKLIKFCM